MTGPYKEGDFESAIEAYLTDPSRGGAQWQAGSPANYDRKLALDTVELDAFIDATQQKAIDTLVSTRFSGDAVKTRATLHQTVAKMLDAHGVLHCLRAGVTVLGVDFELAYWRPESGLTEELNERYAANRLTLTRQLAYSTKTNDELDLGLFINGIPVATAELKNKLTKQSVMHAIKQFRSDRDPIETIFARRAIANFAVDTDEVYVASKLAGQDTVFLPFNRGHDGGKGNPPGQGSSYSTSYLWEQVWQRDNWLDILRRFVHVVKTGGSETVIFPRYHQWDAVLKLLADAKAKGPGHNYLIEHSAGSGKSNTIAWLAHRLAVLHANDEPVFDKVIIVTDRRALDQQLGDTVYQFEHKAGMVQKTRSGSVQLAGALSSATARIIISTLQKFPFVLEKLDDLPDANYAVIIDEAHSSQGGEAAKALKTALGGHGKKDDGGDDDELTEEQIQDLIAESVNARGKQANLSYFAFTATPTRRTLEIFGSEAGGGKRGPFHLYSMRQAIEEGFILDVLKRYTPYSVLWLVASKSKEDKEVEKGKATQAIVRYVNQHPKTLEDKARIIVEHFTGTVADKIAGKAKAMVVTPSREQAVRTYFALKKAVADLGHTDINPLVAFSDAIEIDGQSRTEAALNGFSEPELPGKFGWTPTGDPIKDAGHNLHRILVVAEKYQTGFDQPLLHTMYVDKKLQGINAVQTLSRLNRIHPDKDDTFVLDFVNSADDIRDAFEDYYEATLTYETDPVELYVAHSTLMAIPVVDRDDEQAFAGVFLGSDPDDKSAHAQLLAHLEPAVERYNDLPDDDARKAFRNALAKFLDIYGFMAQVIAFNDPKLEATFLYGRHLQNALPREQTGTLDLGGDIVLTHLRIEAGAEQDASPSHGGDVTDPESGKPGQPLEPEIDQLTAIIHDLNTRFGADLGSGDRIVLEQVLGGMAEDDELVEKAKVNSKDNFLLIFGGAFEEEMLKQENSNKEFFEKFFSDEVFRKDLVAGVGEEFHRRNGGEQMAA